MDGSFCVKKVPKKSVLWPPGNPKKNWIGGKKTINRTFKKILNSNMRIQLKVNSKLRLYECTTYRSPTVLVYLFPVVVFSPFPPRNKQSQEEEEDTGKQQQQQKIPLQSIFLRHKIPGQQTSRTLVRIPCMYVIFFYCFCHTYTSSRTSEEYVAFDFGKKKIAKFATFFSNFTRSHQLQEHVLGSLKNHFNVAAISAISRENRQVAIFTTSLSLSTSPFSPMENKNLSGGKITVLRFPLSPSRIFFSLFLCSKSCPKFERKLCVCVCV